MIAEYKISTVRVGCAPNLPWWRALAMTDDEIKTYNEQYVKTMPYEEWIAKK